VSFTPEVSLLSVAQLQPEEDSIPGSGSLTLHVTDTSLVYRLLLPTLPRAWAEISGAVLSTEAEPDGRQKVAMPLIVLFIEGVSNYLSACIDFTGGLEDPRSPADDERV